MINSRTILPASKDNSLQKKYYPPFSFRDLYITNIFMKILKSLGFAMFFASLFVNVAHANNGNATNSTGDPADRSTNPNTALSKIFFNGIEENTLFIDFEGLADPLASICIYRGNEVMMSDDVSDLPLNVIYEVNLDVIRTGEYTLVLETVDGIKIQKDIRVE